MSLNMILKVISSFLTIFFFVDSLNYILSLILKEATRDIDLMKTLQSNLGLLINDQPVSPAAAIETKTERSLRDLLLSPDIMDQINNENAMTSRFGEDMAKFNQYQSNRWRAIQDKLDSVHPSTSRKNIQEHRDEALMISARNRGGGGVQSSITMIDSDGVHGLTQTKPEFKYKGPKEAQDIVVALYDYTSQRNDELDLKKGDELYVLLKENDQWWMGELIETKQQGYFPPSYVQDRASILRAQHDSLMHQAINKQNKQYSFSLNKTPSNITPNVSASIAQQPFNPTSTNLNNISKKNESVINALIVRSVLF
jgi:hypothetical protein